MTQPFRVIVFTWDAGGLRLSESLSQAETDERRTGVRSIFAKPAVASTIFEALRYNIRIVAPNYPELVVISTQDEDITDTYFHSDLLPREMRSIGYVLLKRNRLEDVGEQPSGNLQKDALTGQPSGSALRLSVYARENIASVLRAEEARLGSFAVSAGGLSLDQGPRHAGALVAYVSHPEFGRFAFIAVDLPRGGDYLHPGAVLSYEEQQAATRAANTLCLISIMSTFVTSVRDTVRPDHVFLFGDMNYDLNLGTISNARALEALTTTASAQVLQGLQQTDGFTLAMHDVPLRGFKEGISGGGPNFYPSWRMRRGRGLECRSVANSLVPIPPVCFDLPAGGKGGLGWYDRISYRDQATSNYIVHCVEYARIDADSTLQSDHAAVLGVFEVRPVRPVQPPAAGAQKP